MIYSAKELASILGIGFTSMLFTWGLTYILLIKENKRLSEEQGGHLNLQYDYIDGFVFMTIVTMITSALYFIILDLTISYHQETADYLCLFWKDNWTSNLVINETDKLKQVVLFLLYFIKNFLYEVVNTLFIFISFVIIIYKTYKINKQKELSYNQSAVDESYSFMTILRVFLITIFVTVSFSLGQIVINENIAKSTQCQNTKVDFLKDVRTQIKCIQNTAADQNCTQNTSSTNLFQIIDNPTIIITN